MFYFKRVYFFSLLFFVSSFLFAQKLVFKHFGIDQGLPSSIVYNTFQDSKGYLWFSTEMGVARYDGFNFKIYNSEDGLVDDIVFQVYEDYAGRIWFRNMAKQLCYLENEKIIEYPGNDLLQIKNQEYSVISSVHNTKDTLFVGFTSGTAICIAGKKVTSLQMSFFYPNKNELFWFKCIGNKFIAYLPTGSSILLYDTILAKRSIRPVCIELKNGNYLLGNDKRLILFNNSIVLNKISYKSRIYSVLEDSNGNIWIGTYANGVYFYQNGNLQNPNPVHYFAGMTVSVYEDREQNIWLATKENGVYLLSSIEYMSYTKEEQLGNNLITCLEAVGDTLLIGFNNGQTKFLYNQKIYNINLLGLNSKTILLIKNTFKNTFIIAHSTDNFWDDILVVEKNKIVSLFKLKDRIKSFYFDKKNEKILIGTRLRLFEYSKNLKADTLLKSIRINAVYSDSGKIWIGNFDGLWLLMNGKLSYYGNHFWALRKNIIGINKSKEGLLWVITNGHGLVAFKNNRFYSITTANGLLSNNCTSLLIDEKNKIVWIGTNKGLNKITYQEKDILKYEIESYTTNNGLVSNQISAISIIKDTVYIATDNGITFFNYKKVSPIFSAPLINISGIQINGQNRDIPLQRNLHYKENRVSISFSGISIRSQRNLKYKYKLIGMDANWYLTNNQYVDFMNLKPGSYFFQVYAQSSNGVWSDKPAVLSFTISPPFWQTWWFIAFCIIITVSGLWLFIYLKLAAIKKKNFIKQQLVELENKALRSQMNPHFIFNILSSIQNFILKNDTEKATLYLIKFSQLVRYILNTSKETKILLSDEIQMLNLYLELEKLRLGNKMNYIINLNNLKNAESIEIPIFLIQPYVENSIWHGINNKETSTGHINIDLSIVENKYLICIVEDNGIGRKKAGLQRENKSYLHNSIGMKNIQQRIALLYDSSVNVEDLTDSDGNATGTKVILKININEL